MKKTFASILPIALTAVLLLVAALPASAQINMSRYVALGDSLGAAFMSGGLIGDAQRYSYPALVYSQANGTMEGFALPTVTSPGVPPILQLVGLSPILLTPADGLGEPDNLFFPGLYGNLSVPGADINDIVNTTTGGLHDVILRGLGTQLEQALAQRPTAVSLWVNNDILGAVISGVVIDGVTLTRTEDFTENYLTVVGALSEVGADLILSTIAPTTVIPYVNTLPTVVVNPATNEPVLVNGATVPLLGPDGPLVPGQDFVLLSATGELAAGFGIPVELGGRGEPLSTFSVLSADEVAAIEARTEELNNVIIAAALETEAVLVDLNSRIREVATDGLHLGGVEFNGDFLTGGLFSYDAVHATPLGYAWTANQIINALNVQRNAGIPRVPYGPYVFGDRNAIGTGLPFGATNTSVIMTPKATAHLMEALDVPSKKQLRRILNRRARQ